MKLCTFVDIVKSPEPRAGLVLGDSVADLKDAVTALAGKLGEMPILDFSRLIEALQCGRPAMDTIEKVHGILAGPDGPESAGLATTPLAETRLLAPLPRPNSIRDFLLFDEHLANCMHTAAKQKFAPLARLDTLARDKLGKRLIKPPASWTRVPGYYRGNADTVIGTGEEILWPCYTEALDYELEFGLYILGSGKDIKAKDAAEYIAGYTVFNDVSARDEQMVSMATRLGPGAGKDFDTSNVMGPFLVTPGEVGDPYSLRMEAFVNGEKWSEGISSGMRFSFEEVIEYVSRSETLAGGDFFGSGTVPTGCGLELDRWVRPGDTVRLEVEKLGAIENRIARKK